MTQQQIPQLQDEQVEPDFIPKRLRAFIYSVVNPVGLLFAFYGVMSDVEWGLWAGLVTSIVGNGTAFAYRPARVLDA